MITLAVPDLARGAVGLALTEGLGNALLIVAVILALEVAVAAGNAPDLPVRTRQYTQLDSCG